MNGCEAIGKLVLITLVPATGKAMLPAHSDLFTTALLGGLCVTSRGNRCIHTYTVVVLLLLQSCYKDRDSDVAKKTYCSIPLMSVSEYLDCCQFTLVIRVSHTYTMFIPSFALYAEGSHTLSKTVVKSMTGGLAAFAKVRATCIGCKALLTGNGEKIKTFH